MIDEPPVSPVGQPPQGSSASVHGEPPESPARRQDSASSHSASSHSASSLGSGASDAGSLGSRSLDPAIAARLKRNPDGLIPAIAQQHDTGEVLMLAWMNDEALHRTLTTGRATYWSRSRKEYWVKGETSGHVQRVVSVSLDCDGDTILVAVDQTGPACHTGSRTCFDGRALI